MLVGLCRPLISMTFINMRNLIFYFVKEKQSKNGVVRKKRLVKQKKIQKHDRKLLNAKNRKPKNLHVKPLNRLRMSLHRQPLFYLHLSLEKFTLKKILTPAVQK